MALAFRIASDNVYHWFAGALTSVCFIDEEGTAGTWYI